MNISYQHLLLCQTIYADSRKSFRTKIFTFYSTLGHMSINIYIFLAKLSMWVADRFSWVRKKEDRRNGIKYPFFFNFQCKNTFMTIAQQTFRLYYCWLYSDDKYLRYTYPYYSIARICYYLCLLEEWKVLSHL